MPAADPSGQPPEPLTLLGWLRERSDPQLARLLRARPDLALPAPPDVTALAARLAVRSSVQRAVDGLNGRSLAALEALVREAPPAGPAGRWDELFDLALVWGPASAPRVSPGVADVLRGADVFGAAAWSPDPTGEPPAVRLHERSPSELDALATTAVAELLRRVEALASAWSAQPPPLLRTGGVGVRELRRTARQLGVQESTAAVLVEVAHAAGLLNATVGIEPVYLPTAEYDRWTTGPTATRWTDLAVAWLGMTRNPALAGERDERGRVLTVLGPELDRGTVPALRRQVLELLAALPPGAAPADRGEVLARLAWQAPRRARGQRPVLEAVLREADLLGVSAAGGLTGWTRTLLAGAQGVAVPAAVAGAAAQALSQALPVPVEEFLVQPDLTVVVPGPPVREVAVQLDRLADLESSGGASVYRITEQSVRRALDAGHTAGEVSTFLTTHSRTPLPQALDYLIEDAARRHGVLRAGTAGSYLRCEDAALLARVMADRVADSLGLRQLAPTVVVADVPVTRVLEALRGAGFAPAAEGSDGAVVNLDAEPPRAPSRPPARVVTTRRDDRDAALAETVRRMRVGDDLAQRGARAQQIAGDVPGVTSASTMEVLRRAVREGRTVALGCAEPDGRATSHVLEPISLAAGSVRGYERGKDGLTSYPVHRITSVQLVDDEP